MDVLSRPLSESELCVILDNSKSYYRDCMLISLGTGLRISDLILLTKDLPLPHFEIIEQKTKKIKKVFVPDWCLTSWMNLVINNQENDYLFKVRDKSSYRKYIKSIASHYGLNPNGVSWHSLRKTSASQLAAIYGPQQAQIFLNHKNIDTTFKYITFNHRLMNDCFSFLGGHK